MVRKPLVSEAAEIKNLIDPFVKEGLMLPKSLHALCTSVRDFWIMTSEHDPSEIVGCCALQISWTDMAEIRTLAVRKDYQRAGAGRTLVNACINEARDLGVKTLFALTYVPEFFVKAGFTEVSKSTLPNKIWSDCIHCQHFPNCSEQALILRIED